MGEMSPRVAAGLSRLLRPVQCSGDHIRSIGTTSNKESGRFLTCYLNTEQDTTIVIDQCTAVQSHTQADFAIKVHGGGGGGQPNISR